MEKPRHTAWPEGERNGKGGLGCPAGCEGRLCSFRKLLAFCFRWFFDPIWPNATESVWHQNLRAFCIAGVAPVIKRCQDEDLDNMKQEASCSDRMSCLQSSYKKSVACDTQNLYFGIIPEIFPKRKYMQKKAMIKFHTVSTLSKFRSLIIFDCVRVKFHWLDVSVQLIRNIYIFAIFSEKHWFNYCKICHTYFVVATTANLKL